MKKQQNKTTEKKEKCGAKTRAGGRCQRWAMQNGRCHLHGGRSLAGAASPSFKHGRYSRYLPAGLADRYQAAAKDPELLALSADVALVEARITQLLERLSGSESSAAWASLNEQWAALDTAMRVGDAQAAQVARAEISALLARGAEMTETWAEIVKLQDHRRRLTESENNARVKAGQLIAVGQVVSLLTAAAEDLREIVSREADPAQARRILSDHARSVRRLLGEVGTA